MSELAVHHYGAREPRRWDPPKTVPAEHLPSPTNPRIHLCQEYDMRSPDRYDHVAQCTVVDDPRLAAADVGRFHAHTPDSRYWRCDVRHVAFADVVAVVGTDEAIRLVEACTWMSRDDFTSTEPVPCTECLEVHRG